jgi:hypothetical protein
MTSIFLTTTGSDRSEVHAEIVDRDGDRVEVCVGEWLALYGRTEDESDLGQILAIGDGIEVAWTGECATLTDADARRCLVFRVRPTTSDIAADVDMGPTLAARLLDGDRDDEASSTFSRLNNAGEGFDPDDEIAAWDLVYRAQNDTEVSIYEDGYDAILVGDVNGPWAVRVSA